MMGKSNIKYQKSKIRILTENTINNPLFAGSFIMIFGSNAVSFINYLYHLVMGRMLGPASYGELASVISSIGLLGVLPASVSLVIIKYVSSIKDGEEMDNLIGWLKSKILLACLVFSIIMLLFVPFIASFLRISNIFFLLLTLSFFFSLQGALNRSILQGLLKFKEMVISILIENSAKLIVSMVLIYLGFQVGGAMSALIVSALLGWHITNLFLKYHPGKKTYLPPYNIKSMLVFAIPVAIQYIATTSLYSSDVILVKHFFSSYDAGIYAALSTLARIIFFGAGPIGAVMFPLVSQRSSRGQAHKRIFIYSLLVSMLLSGSILLIYWLYPELAIRLLYGAQYLKAANLLVWSGIFITLFTLSSLLINYGLSLGKTSIVVLPSVAAIAQILMILLFHKTLYTIILISIVIAALLLISLLIYSILYARKSIV